MIVSDINIANQKGASLYKCCEVVGINASIYYRCHEFDEVVGDRHPTAKKLAPKNKLLFDEVQAILEVCCQK